VVEAGPIPSSCVLATCSSRSSTNPQPLRWRRYPVHHV